MNKGGGGPEDRERPLEMETIVLENDGISEGSICSNNFCQNRFLNFNFSIEFLSKNFKTFSKNHKQSCFSSQHAKI